MANLTQIIEQIRFGIEQLSSKNLFHDFEHLCRHLTRKRICSNIVPSTGPVSSYGDLGIDFKTFHTYLKENFTTNSPFIGLVSDKPIIFCCSLNKSFEAKIKEDIIKITKNKTNVERIIYFSGQDIAIGKKKQIEKWALEKYKQILEIHDAQSISELLADTDTFWIAVQYLNIPSEIFPQSSNKGWYSSKLRYYKENQSCLYLTYEEFIDIKNVARHIFKKPQFHTDLLFWIEMLKKFINADIIPILKHKAIYEYLVLRRAILQNLDSDEAITFEYFKILDKSDLTTSDLEDLSVMLIYMYSAQRTNLISIDDSSLEKWKNEIVVHVDRKLSQSISPNTKCLLYEIRAFMEFNSFTSTKKNNVAEAVKWYKKLIKIIPNAPLFHLETFTDRIHEFIKILKSYKQDTIEFEKIAIKSEKLLSKRYGDFSAAEKARERAQIYFDNDEFVKTIKTLHEIKIKSYSDERIKGTIQSMLLLAETYQKLHLNYAAKYYALVCSFFVANSPDLELLKFLPKSIIIAANSDYKQGSWLNYFDLIKFGLLAHTNIQKELFNDHFSQSILFYVANLLILSKKYNLSIYADFEREIGKWEGYKNEIFTIEKDSKEFSENINNEGLEKIFTDFPFNDLGNPRTIRWKAMGILWIIEFNNDYENNSTAEEFIAMMQILQVELANNDLCLLSTSVKIKLNNANNDKISFKAIPLNYGREWEVNVPKYNNNKNSFGELSKNTFIVITTILNEVSLIKNKDFVKIIDKNVKEGLANKLTFFESYSNIYREFVKDTDFSTIERRTKIRPNGFDDYKIQELDEFKFINEIGPTYNKQVSLDAIKKRYSHSIKPIKHTLPKLKKEIFFINLVEKLKSKGWKDWHILMALANLVINYRMNLLNQNHGNPITFMKIFMTKMFADEKPNDPVVPFSEINEDKLYEFLHFTMGSTLAGWELESHQRTPDILAIENFLSKRYNYWEDDIDHDNIFF